MKGVLLIKLLRSGRRKAAVFSAIFLLGFLAFWDAHLGVGEEMSLEEFALEYDRICEDRTPRYLSHHTLPWCPCLPYQLIGEHNISHYLSHYRSYSSTEASMASADIENESEESRTERVRELLGTQDVSLGGHWRPRDCHARQKVAIIVPFRHREGHLAVLENYLHAFLQRQQLDYSLYVIEQASPSIFNRAAMMNIGYLEARRRRPGGYDCYIFHDVDLLPENDLNMYTCYMSPLHLGAYMNKFHYQLPYRTFFGGAIALDSSTINATNGFPTRYYGWGGEDDEIWSRLKWQKRRVNRYPTSVGQSYMLTHDADEDNPINPKRDDGYVMRTSFYEKEGLSSIKYTTDGVRESPLHTKITVSIEQTYDESCIIDQSRPPTLRGNYRDCMDKEAFMYGTIDCCRNAGHVYCCDKYKYAWTDLQLPVVIVCFSLIGLLCAYVIKRHKNASDVIKNDENRRNCSRMVTSLSDKIHRK